MAQPQFKTPGVYLEELDAFGNAVVPVPTAVPAFIGYTLNTSFNNQDITNQFIKITSLTDFTTIFGTDPPNNQFKVENVVYPDQFNAMTVNLTTQATKINTAITGLSTAAVKTTLTTAMAKFTIPTLASAADVQAQITLVKTALSAAQSANPVIDQDVKACIDVLAYANEYYAYVNAANGTQLSAVITAQNNLDKANNANPVDPTAVNSATDALNAAKSYYSNLEKDIAFSTKAGSIVITQSSINYRLYASIKLFFNNGGGHCYVYSIGGYDYTQSTIADTTAFQNALTALSQETEPTILVIPDAVEIIKPGQTTYEATYGSCYTLQSQMLSNCGTTANRIAILDIPGGYYESLVGETHVDVFRNMVSGSDPKFNSYGAAYYPWVNTDIYSVNDIGVENINTSSYSTIYDLLVGEFTDPKTLSIPNKLIPYINVFAATPLSTDPTLAAVTPDQANAALMVQSNTYQLVMNSILGKLNLLPPSAAMAGLYTTVDNNEGVWVAPANIAMQSVLSPALRVTDDSQEDLNVPIDGKSICAIRAFTGRGTLVWGARTLDGNSNDWRYINVRRTMMYIEQSVKDAAFAYVFAPNVSSTWIDVQSMISNFLLGLWSQGGLAGTKPADAFSVSVGLGSTMTSDDILAGVMRVAVKVAISHPAEFIDITFEQQMQA